MKNVDIISKVVARKGEAMASPSKGAAPSVDLSGYLLKEIWDRIFEIRSTENGEEYIFCKTSLAAQGGLTMYVDGGLLNLPSIYDGLPIDGKTLFWEEVIADDGTKSKVLKSKGGGGGSIEYPLSWSGFSSGSYDGTAAKTIYIPSKVSELTNDSTYISQSTLSTYLKDYLPLSGGTLTGTLTAVDIVAEEISGGGGNLYIGNANNSAYVYLNEDMRSASNDWSISKAGAASFSSLKVDGTSVSPDNYITSIDNVQATAGDATIDRYLGITKGGVTTNLTVGYAKHSELLKAYSVSDLSTNAAWNTSNGLRCSSFSASASNIPTSAGTNANSLITFMPTWNYGYQIACLNSLSTGYDGIPHLFFRNFVNGSYKEWYRIVTDGPQMQFQGIDWNYPYFRIRYQTNDWYYIRPLSNGLWLGMYDNGVRIDSSGNGDFSGYITCKGNIGIGGVSGVNTSINLYSYDNSGYQFSNRITDGKMLRIYYRSSAGQFTNVMEIGTTGNLLVTGGITMYSDNRKKTILGNVELSLKDIADAPLVEHYYNTDENKTTHVGSIAQYWYGLNDWFCKEDHEGYLTMEIQNAALASAISIARELDRYETKTDNTIKKLKKRICELEEEVEQLKNR